MGNIHGVGGPKNVKLRLAQAKSAAALSLLFLIVYGGASWITAQRADVGTWFFEWERHIPFVPLMIIPYMSIDLFFVAAPFLYADPKERRVFEKRIALSIVVAGVFFLLMPLRFAFPRPHVEGWLAPIFQFLHGFDRPYNLFPSLHIALRTILVETYAKRTKGFLNGVVHVWFSLIGFSTVLIYQHHVIDLVGGFLLAAVCFYLIRATPIKSPVTKNKRIGFYYTVGTVLSLLATFAVWPWGALFLWPAVSLGIVTAAYFGWTPSIHRKEGGRLPLSTKIILGPALMGQHLSWLYYKTRARPWDEVAPRLLIGRRLTDAEADQAKRQGVGAVLDLTSEFSEARPFLKTHYLNLPILDLTAPTVDQLEEAAAFIRHNTKDTTVYVHCKIGYSRSAAAVGAYLLKTGAALNVESAVAMMRRARPSLIVRSEAMEALKDYHRRISPTAPPKHD